MQYMQERQTASQSQITLKIFADFADPRARKVEAKVGSIVIIMEGIAFEKYPAICVPQACQGVGLLLRSTQLYVFHKLVRVLILATSTKLPQPQR